MGKPAMALREIRKQRRLRSPSVQQQAFPSPEQVQWYASITIRSIMTNGGKAKTGSNKSGPGEWFTRDSIRYSADRAISHLTTALMMLDGNKDEDSEGILGHLQRALCRVAFVSVKVAKGQRK
jgi:hypothetical protein